MPSGGDAIPLASPLDKSTSITQPEETLLLPYADSLPSSPTSYLLWRFLLAAAIFITSIAMTVPVRPLLILKAASGDLSFASYFTGIVDSLQAILAIFSAPVLGAASDVIGRKPILMLSHFGELIALLLVAQFPFSLYAQFPAYILIALTSVYTTTINTIIADIAIIQGDPLAAVKSYAYLGTVVGFCFLIGPTLGGVIEDSFYLASSFHVASAGIVVAMLYVFFSLPETKPGISNGDELDSELTGATFQSRWTSAWSRVITGIGQTEINPIPRLRGIFLQNDALTWLAVAISISSLAQSGLNSIIFLYVNARLDWGPKETGLFLSMVGLSLLISQGILSPLAAHYVGEKNTILVGFFLSSVHYIIYAFATRGEIMYLGLAVGALSFVQDPALKSLLARQVNPNSQGALQGSISALSTVVKPFSPLISAVAFGIGNSIGILGLPFFIIGGISFVAFLTVRIAFSKEGLK